MDVINAACCGCHFRAQDNKGPTTPRSILGVARETRIECQGRERRKHEAHCMYISMAGQNI